MAPCIGPQRHLFPLDRRAGVKSPTRIHAQEWSLERVHADDRRLGAGPRRRPSVPGLNFGSGDEARQHPAEPRDLRRQRAPIDDFPCPPACGLDADGGEADVRRCRVPVGKGASMRPSPLWRRSYAARRAASALLLASNSVPAVREPQF